MCCWPLRSAFGVIPTTPQRMLDAGPHFDKFAALLGLNPSLVPPKLQYDHVTLTAWRSAESLQLQQKTVDIYESLARGRGQRQRSDQHRTTCMLPALDSGTSQRDCMA